MSNCDVNLTSKKCLPCEGGVSPLTDSESRSLLARVHADWNLSDDAKFIERKWTLRNFVDALEVVNQVGKLAEEEQHHPDIHLTGYRLLRIVLTTHAIDGLSENDFIVAAKIDELCGN